VNLVELEVFAVVRVVDVLDITDSSNEPESIFMPRR
jgi:hypothetical protein